MLPNDGLRYQCGVLMVMFPIFWVTQQELWLVVFFIYGACSLLVLLPGTFSLPFQGSANFSVDEVVDSVPRVWVGF